MRYVWFGLSAICTLCLVAILLIEANLKWRSSYSKTAEAHVVQMAVAGACPDLPEAMDVAAKSAYWYSLTRPHDLPPWRVFEARIKIEQANASTEPNMFATGFCNEIIGQNMK